MPSPHTAGPPSELPDSNPLLLLVSVLPGSSVVALLLDSPGSVVSPVLLDSDAPVPELLPDPVLSPPSSPPPLHASTATQLLAQTIERNIEAK